jgi:hypothetical protein
VRGATHGQQRQDVTRAQPVPDDRSFVSDLEVDRVNPMYLHLRTLAQMLRLPLAA